MSPGLVKLMVQYSNELDDDRSGKLSIDEILRNRSGADLAAAKLLEQVRHRKKRKMGPKKRSPESKSSSTRKTKYKRASSSEQSSTQVESDDITDQKPYNSVNDSQV